MASLQTRCVHPVTMVGSGRQTTIGFYRGVLGKPLVFIQSNPDVRREEHLSVDTGDGAIAGRHPIGAINELSEQRAAPVTVE